MILVIDDDIAIRQSLKLLLNHMGHTVRLASSPTEGLNALRQQHPKLMIMDMNFTKAVTGEEGLELLRKVKVLAPEVPVILITAWGSIPLAVEGMRLGAMDFITKPWDNRMLQQRIATALELSAPAASAACQGDAAFERSAIIGRNPALNHVLETAARVARTDASVLILGENGTGKELIAEAIHNNSPRRDKPFVKVNLGGISQSLFESEMFGHRKGAFTGAIADRIGRFALADGGTIFLDEIGDLDLSSQVKLLRVLQEHTYEVLGDSTPRRVDIRVISATNANLAKMVVERTFREDLFYRINLITLNLPPLRERRSDIPMLVNHFAAQSAKKLGIQTPLFTPEAMRLLSAQAYPGNVRELRNLIEKVLILTPKPEIGPIDLPLSHTAADITSAPDSNTLGDVELIKVQEAMSQAGGNVSQAASALGISRQSLYRRLQKLGYKK